MIMMAASSHVPLSETVVIQIIQCFKFTNTRCTSSKVEFQPNNLAIAGTQPLCLELRNGCFCHALVACGHVHLSAMSCKVLHSRVADPCTSESVNDKPITAGCD